MSDALESSPVRLAAKLAIGALIIAVLYFGRELLIPLALAMFFCFLLSPLAGFLERRARLGRAPSALLVVAASFFAIGAFGYLVGSQAAGLISDFPKYQDTFVSKVRQVNDSFTSAISSASDVLHRFGKNPPDESQNQSSPSQDDAALTRSAQDHSDMTESSPESAVAVPEENALAKVDRQQKDNQPVKVELVPARHNFLTVVGMVLGPVMHPLATFGATTILLIFFLVNRDDLRDRLIRVIGQAHIHLTTTALHDCARRIMRFLTAQAFANCVIGFVTGLGLYFMGVPSAALWGLLAAFARFLPYIGALIATFLPFALSVAVFDSWQVPIMVVGWCVLVDMLSANVLEPLLYGARTGVSPTAILLAFMFWTWIWGGVGLFLATPITVCLVVLGKHIPALHGLYILMSDEQVLEPAARLYQRLLARDSVQSGQIVTQYVEQNGGITAVEHVILPGLAQIEADRHAGLIEADRLKFIQETARNLVDIALPEGETNNGKPPLSLSPRSRIAVITNAGALDDVAAKILQRIGQRQGIPVMAFAPETLASEVMEQIHEMEPAGVIFTAIEPRNIGRLRHIFKKFEMDQVGIRVEVQIFAVTPHVARGGARFARDCSATENRDVSQVFSQFTISDTKSSSSQLLKELRVVAHGL